MLGRKPPRAFRGATIVRSITRRFEGSAFKLAIPAFLALVLGAGCAAQSDVEQVSQNEQAMRQMVATEGTSDSLWLRW